MDRLTAMIAIAQLRLRLDLVEKFPHLLEGLDMAKFDIRRPMELAGLTSQLARAKKQRTDIAATAVRYNKVQDLIDDLHDAAKQSVGHDEIYAGELKSTIESMIAGSNGDPNDDGRDGRDEGEGSDKVGQIITSKTGEG